MMNAQQTPAPVFALSEADERAFHDDAATVCQIALRWLATRVLGAGAAAEEAALCGSFVAGGCEVRITHDPQRDQVSIRCALVSMPTAGVRLLRNALGFNFREAPAGICVGIDPATDSLQAVSQLNMGVLMESGIQALAAPLVQQLAVLGEVAECDIPLLGMIGALPEFTQLDGGTGSAGPSSENTGLNDFIQQAFSRQLERLAGLLPATGGGTHRPQQCFDVDGTAVAVQLLPQTAQVGFYADAGMSAQDDDAASLYRRMLHRSIDQHGTSPAWFGLHPTSDRLVAFKTFSLLLLDTEGHVARDIMSIVGREARELRSQ